MQPCFQAWREAGSEAAGAAIPDSPGVLLQVEAELLTLGSCQTQHQDSALLVCSLAFANTIRSNYHQEWCVG